MLFITRFIPEASIVPLGLIAAAITVLLAQMVFVYGVFLHASQTARELLLVSLGHSIDEDDDAAFPVIPKPPQEPPETGDEDLDCFQP